MRQMTLVADFVGIVLAPRLNCLSVLVSPSASGVDTVHGEHTMRPSDFAPDDPYLRPSNLLSRAVDEGYLLAQIESEKRGVRLRDWSSI